MGKHNPENAARYQEWYAATENGKAARKRAQDKFRGSEKWRESHRVAVAAYRARSQERRLAHSALTEAIEKGRLTRPEACGSCGGLGPVHGHHRFGYAAENRLNVVWLCGPCHRIEHPPGRPKKLVPLGSDLVLGEQV